MSVKVIYQITLLNETYDLTEEEFKALQPECEEIALFGKMDGYVVIPHPSYSKAKATGFADGINSAPIEAAEIPESLDEVVLSKTETTIKPMDTKALTDRIDKMEPYKSRKDIDPYIEMHEAGEPIEAIKNQMLKDKFCPQGSLSYHIKKVLSGSTRVTKIELESAAETTDETIDRLKRENAEGKEKRKQPKMAVKKDD